MDPTDVLWNVLIVLVGAKVAAELAERIGLPAVVGEIAAGVLLGPSVLGWVELSEPLEVFAELGVILLLLEVGLHLDLAELGAVGTASLRVAVVGVVLPFALGLGAVLALGHDLDAALFLAAALTATSVGITARVFADLGMLSRVEARLVLGAAVVDDVLGLLVLTIVVRAVLGGDLTVASVASLVLVAVGFLVVVGWAGARLAPVVFGWISRLARGAGTPVGLALAFALALAALARAAELAPIIGAFVAGLALARTTEADRIRRELAPLGHVFVPVFFLQIGAQADLDAMLRPAALGLAAVLTVIGVIGKLASAGAIRAGTADRLTVGIGMIPRGEVGLIVAGLGLSSGVLDRELFGGLLLMVLATTVIAPPLLGARLRRLAAAAATAAAGPATPVPGSADGGATAAEIQASAAFQALDALRVSPTHIDLKEKPPAHRALEVAWVALREMGPRRPGPLLVEWLSDDVPVSWSIDARDAFIDVLTAADPRALRLAELSGLLGACVPELADALRSRARVAFDLDGPSEGSWPMLSTLRARRERGGLDVADREWWVRTPRSPVLVAALVFDATGVGAEVSELAGRVAGRIGLDAEERALTSSIAGGARALEYVASRGGADEVKVAALATRLGSSAAVCGAALLNAADIEIRDGEHSARLRPLSSTVAQVAASVAELDALGTVAHRRNDAMGEVERRAASGLSLHAPVAALRRRIDRAPVEHVVAVSAAELVRHAELMEPPPPARVVRAEVRPGQEPNAWVLDVVANDRVSLLADMANAIGSVGASITRARLSTWPDGVVLDTFHVVTADGVAPDVEAIERAMERPRAAAGSVASTGSAAPARSWRVDAPGIADVTVEFLDAVVPGRTVVAITAPDRERLLGEIAVRLAAAGVDVRGATVDTADGLAIDHFEVTNSRGRALEPSERARVRAALVGGVAARWRRVLIGSGSLA